MSMIDDALKGMGQGAALGSVIPGIGTAIGAGAGGLLGVAMNVMPGAAHWLGGSADIAGRTIAAVQSVTGQADPISAQAAVDGDPALAGDLRVQLAQIAEDARTAELADVADARATTVQLVQAGSSMSWGAAIVSVVVLTTFAGAMLMTLLRAIPENAEPVLNVLLGSLTAMATSVVSYWVGSSVGSASKDARLANSVPASMLSKPLTSEPK